MQEDIEDISREDISRWPVCVCAENLLYFHIVSQDPPVRDLALDGEFWQHSLSLR